MAYKFTPKQAREYAGLSQAELANRMGLSEQTIRNYETGFVEMKLPVLNMWSQVTGVSLDDIFLPCDSTKSRETI